MPSLRVCLSRARVAQRNRLLSSGQLLLKNGQGRCGMLNALNGESGPPLVDAVAVFFEMAISAVINGKEQLCRARDIHGAEYKAELRSCKAPERRSRDARPVRALRSLFAPRVT
ncbi:hypothetical protein BBW68_04235 [Candidatus Erwinia dacicola]|uniref:Uncharacterized protein n=1 Tax=Candidatus Erwinia dacicola TaxID=252393 RepID=A0A1E7Z4P6_9GAMM|nr:hypothetical protein BBW68_04235 [Candidatus Erwinia dacicola]